MSEDLPVVRLRPGREKSLLRRHPWVFSGAVEGVDGDPAAGAAVEVRSARGDFLARGFWSPDSQIRVRAVVFDETETPDAFWLGGHLAAAWALRAPLWNAQTRNALRVVHGEGDGLPGLVVDRYADALCVQILSAGFERLRSALAAQLLDLFPTVSVVYERSDAPARAREGLPPRAGVLAERPGAAAPDLSRVEIVSCGIRSTVDLVHGQKTGTYLDQAENRARVGAFAAGCDVLDAFCYDGGFSLACLAGGAASVTAVDASAEALDAFRANLALNGHAPDRAELLCADVGAQLRAFRDSRRSFDLIVLDPPKFADSKNHVEKACRAYKDANRLAFKLLRPGGLLATFSCSGAIDPALFATVVAEAACEAGRDARIVGRFDQSPDHPVSLACPEGLYLKGLLCAAP